MLDALSVCPHSTVIHILDDFAVLANSLIRERESVATKVTERVTLM